MRLVRLIVRGIALLVLCGALTAVALVVTLRTPAGRAVVRDRVVQILADATGARVTLGAVDTLGLSTVAVRDLALSFGGGQSVLRARRVEIAFALPLPVPATLRARHVVVDGLAAHLVHRGGGFGFPAIAPGAGGLAIDVRRLLVRDARIGVVLTEGEAPRRLALARVSVDAALAGRPDETRLVVHALRATPRGLPAPPLEARASLRSSRDGSLDIHVLATTHAPASLGPGAALPGGTRLDATVRGPRHALRAHARLDVPGAGAVRARAHVVATGATPAYRLAADTASLSLAVLTPGAPDDPVRATLRVRGTGSRLAAHGRLSTAAARAAWRAEADLDHDPTVRGDIRGTVDDLARLPGGLAGRFPFTLEIAGSARATGVRRMRAHVEIGTGVIGGTPIREARATAHRDGARWRVDAMRITSDVWTLAGSGLVDPQRGVVGARATVSLPGRLDADVALALARRGATWTGTIDALGLAPAGASAWHSSAPASLAVGDGMRVRDLRLRSGAQQAVVTFTLGRRGTLAGALDVSALDLGAPCALAGATCAGTVTGRLDVTGTTASPHLELAATATGLAAGPLRNAALEVRASHARERATGTAVLRGLGGTVTLEGSLPLALPGRGAPAASAPLDLTLTARRLNLERLGMLAPTIVRTATGRARADLRLDGTWAAPRPSGTLTLRAPRLELAPSGASWRDVEVVLRADGATALAVERFTARGGAGTLAGSGSFDFRDGVIPVAHLQLAFDRFLAVDRPVLDALVDGTLRIDGPLLAPAVHGKLYVPEGALKPAFLPAANASTEPDPTIEVVGLPDAAAAAPVAGLGDLTLALTLTLGDGMRIKRRDADIQLGGTLRVTRTPPDPIRVTGTVEIERGWYTFSGRRFTMRDGSVRFTGGKIGDAALDLEAGRRSGEYDVTVAVQGTVAKPVLLLSSDPPLDESDVLAVLLVGRPSGELNDTERLGVQAEAASLAVSYAVPGLTDSFGEALPLEQIQVSPEQVRIGHRVGSDVFISLSQQFVGWAGQTVAIEYEITRRLSVELSTSSRGSGAVDVFWRRRY